MTEGISAEKDLVPAESPEWLEKGRWLFAQVCVFLRGCTDFSNLLPESLSEVAFAGRSNVGKSSLINALVGRHNLARASNTPGRTQEINFFSLNDQIYLVDLPGYGYAEAPRDKVSAWNRLIRDYLRGRTTLKRVYVLIDSRHGIKANDQEIFKLLDDAAMSYQIVLTKIDKISEKALEQCLQQTQELLKKRPAAHPVVIATSSEKNKGIDLLRAEIAALSNWL
jgi:GTP-binding protein